MRITLALAFDERVFPTILNVLARQNARIFREQKLPMLYRSNVRYEREDTELWCDVINTYAQGVEDCDGLSAVRAGEIMAYGWRALHPDYLAPTNEVLRQHAASRATARFLPTGFAEAKRLNLRQIRAEVFLATRTAPGEGGLFHCLVRYRVNGRWYEDDPSARLGMYDRSS
jgi:hypothetical protein